LQVLTLSILPLSEANLKDACTLVDNVFLGEGVPPSLTLHASIYPDQHRAYWKAHRVTYLELWVALSGNQLSGICGLFGRSDDFDDAVWLSWFCVDERFQRRGIGKRGFGLQSEKQRRWGNDIFACTPQEAHPRKRLNIFMTAWAMTSLVRNNYKQKSACIVRSSYE
jgi:hypothetical protein